MHLIRTTLSQCRRISACAAPDSRLGGTDAAAMSARVTIQSAHARGAGAAASSAGFRDRAPPGPVLLAALCAFCTQGVVAGAIVLPPAEPPQQISIDVRTSQLSGRLLLGSQPSSGAAPASFAIELIAIDDPADSLALARYHDPGFNLPVVSGTYQPNYTHLFGAAAPGNADQRLPSVINAGSDPHQDIDVVAVEVQPQFSLDGAPFPCQATEVAEFYLLPQGSGERILLGRSNLAASTVRVLPGTYSVVYSYRSGSALPINPHAVVRRDVVLAESGVLAVAVRSTVLATSLTLNGQAFPNSAYDYGSVYLRNAGDDDEVHLGETFSGPAERRIVDGSYDVHFRSRESQGVTPMNPDAVIARGVAISPGQQRLTVDVRTIDVSADFRVNGSAPPDSAYDYARIGLRFDGTSAVLPLGETHEQSSAPVRIIPGDYQAIYSHREGATLPANVEAVFIQRLSLTGSGSVVLDIPRIELRLDLSLNGRPFPVSAYSYAHIHARPSAGRLPGGAPVLLGATYQGPLSVPLIAGRYDFVYEVRESGGDVPVNRYAPFLEDSNLEASATLAHDLKADRVQVGARLNGLIAPSGAGSAEVLVGQSREDRVSVGFLSGRSAPVETLLLHGDYFAYYALRDAGNLSVFPLNRDAAVDEFVIGGVVLFGNGFE